MDDQDVPYRQARRHVRQLRGFYIHLSVYLIVNVGLFVLNLLT